MKRVNNEDVIKEKLILETYLCADINNLSDLLEKLISEATNDNYENKVDSEYESIDDYRERLLIYVNKIRLENYKREIWQFSHKSYPTLCLINSKNIIEYKIQISFKNSLFNDKYSTNIYKGFNPIKQEHWEKMNTFKDDYFTLESITTFDIKLNKHNYAKRIKYKELVDRKNLSPEFIRLKDGLIYYDDPSDSFIIDRFSLFEDEIYETYLFRGRKINIPCSDYEYILTYYDTGRDDEASIDKTNLILDFNMLVFRFDEEGISNSRRSTTKSIQFGCITFNKVNIFMSEYKFIDLFEFDRQNLK